MTALNKANKTIEEIRSKLSSNRKDKRQTVKWIKNYSKFFAYIVWIN